MKSAIINSYGPGHVVLEERERPVAGPDEILVKVGAISLNYVDLMLVRGAFPVLLPYTLGCDAAGIVEAVGINVSRFAPGDRVSTQFMREWQSGPLKESYTTIEARTLGGSFSEYIAVKENALVKAPAHLSLEEIATLPIAALTAWESLFNVGRLRPGETVLLQGTGGVSIFALQFAKLAGASVIITSGSDEKLARAKALGADHTINYKKNPNWHQQVLEATQGKGVDIALEVAGTELDKTRQAVRVGGHIAVVGLVAGTQVDFNVIGFLQRPMTIEAVMVGSHHTFNEMNRAMEKHNLRPVIDKVFPFSGIKEAVEFAAAGNHFGKVVVKL